MHIHPPRARRHFTSTCGMMFHTCSLGRLLEATLKHVQDDAPLNVACAAGNAKDVRTSPPLAHPGGVFLGIV